MLTNVRPVSRMSALVVVLGLVSSKGLVAAFKATCVWSIASVGEKMSAELRTLFEVPVASIAAFPLTDTPRTVVDVSGFDMLVECFGTIERLKTHFVFTELPPAHASLS